MMEDNHLQNSSLFLSPSSTNMDLSKTPTTHSKNKMSIDEFISNLSKSNKVVPDDEVNVNWMAANSSIKTPSGSPLLFSLQVLLGSNRKLSFARA